MAKNDWGKADAVVEDWGTTDEVVTKAPKAAAKVPEPEAPGWFQPGSKSEAVVRGLSQGATLGFGDELQALLRKTANWDRPVSELRDEQRAANDASRAANPAIYTASEIAGSLPSIAAGTGAAKAAGLAPRAAQAAAQGLPASAKVKSIGQVIGGATSLVPKTAMKGGALIGGISGLGNAEGDFGDQLTSTALGAGLGGLAAGIPTKAGQLGLQGAKAAKGLASSKGSDTLIGAGIGGVGSVLGGGSFTEGAVAGAIGGRYGGKMAVNAVKSAAGKINPGMVARGITGTSQLAQATTNALQNLSGQQARSIKNQGDAEIQQSIERGQPSYAATFSKLATDPAYRAATAKTETFGDNDQTEDETADEE